MIENLPVWLRVFILSMVPWLEARYVIPFAMLRFGLEWWQVFPWAILGNMVPVPFILIFFNSIEKFLRRYRCFADILDRLFSLTRKRADEKIRRYEYLGLILFVAIPLPFTGAWTGSLISYLFNLKFMKSVITIFIGVIVAAAITTALTVAGFLLWFSFGG